MSNIEGSSDNISDSELNPNQYFTIYKCNRVGRQVGGVIVFIAVTFRSHQIILSDSDHVDLIESGCELLCFTLLTGSSKIRFFLVYRPPNSSLRIDLPAKMLALTRLIDKFTAISYTTVLLGDFNVPEIDWFNLSFKQNKLNSILVNCISANAMSQFVNTPSRSSRDCDNILDLIFSNDPYSISVSDNIPPLGTSDHDIIQFSIFLPDVSNVSFNCKPLPDVRSIDGSLLHEPSTRVVL